MSVLVFLPQVRESFDRLRDGGALARAGAPALVLGLVGAVVRQMDFPFAGLVGLVIAAVGLGMVGVAWARYLYLGEAPSRPLHVRLGKRELIYAMWHQLLGAFTIVPVVMVATLLPHIPALQAVPMLPLMAQQVFVMLVGMLYLILPDTAVRTKGAAGPLNNDLVRQGGVAVGVGLVVAMLPFTVALHLLEAYAPVTAEAPVSWPRAIVGVLATTLESVVIAGYLALVWKQLQPQVPANPATE